MGRFWAIGVGPGDPDLLTLKAVNLIRQASVIYHAGTRLDQGRAWDIIRRLVRPEQEIRIVLTESMRVVSGSDWKTQYREGVEQIARDCRQGRDVAFVTEGDPSVYSTATCVWQLLAELHPNIPIEIVPGISSITAAAARVAWPLARKDEIFVVAPAHYHVGQLQSLIDCFPTICFLKVPSILPQLSETLEKFGTTRDAIYVENLGTDREWITQDLREAAGRNNYFALVLVRKSIAEEPQANRRGNPVSESKTPADPGGAKQGTGKLWVVGLGPGDPGMLTQKAVEILKSAETIIGYQGYLDLLAPLGLMADFQGSPIGSESERARQAVEQAAQGRQVVLVSSGDAGVYGMASLVLETAAGQPEVEIEMVPGVTAATAAAALLGAPLGHDFACVSLSDLLTPWEVIERRLHVLGQGDFVTALYNPLSQRRSWQLPQARDIFLHYRSPETPVGLVDRAFRSGTRVWQSTLGSLTMEGITMETILIFGSSTTRLVNGRLVTPRGYGQHS